MKLRQVKPILICVDLQLGFLDEDSWGGNRSNKDVAKIRATIRARLRHSINEFFANFSC